MPDVEGQRVPKGNGEGSARPPHGTIFGLNDGGEKVGPSGVEAVSGGVGIKEISQVCGCKIVQSFAG